MRHDPPHRTTPTPIRRPQVNHPKHDTATTDRECVMAGKLRHFRLDDDEFQKACEALPEGKSPTALLNDLLVAHNRREIRGATSINMVTITPRPPQIIPVAVDCPRCGYQPRIR